jgi:hypothetical protein
MVNIPTKKTIYSNNINKVVDTGFNNFVVPPSQESVQTIPTVEEFFNNYDILFFEIPQTGTNSHTELIERSSEYLGLDLNLLLQQLQDLQEQNQQLQKQIDEFNTTT